MSLGGTFMTVLIGAAAMYFYDPDNGHRRRQMAREKWAALRGSIPQPVMEKGEELRQQLGSAAEDVRQQVEDRGADLLQGVSAKGEDLRQRAAGMAHETMASTPMGARTSEPVSDETLKDRIETQLFRDPDIDKGRLLVNCVDGRVYLRGQARDAEQIAEIVRTVRDIEGVTSVENDLRPFGTLEPTPGTQAPAPYGGPAGASQQGATSPDGPRAEGVH
jgi:hypothetical protein